MLPKSFALVLLVAAFGLAGCGRGSHAPVRTPLPDPLTGDCVWVRGLPELNGQVIAPEGDEDIAFMQVAPCDGPYTNYRVNWVVSGKREFDRECDEMIEQFTRRLPGSDGPVERTYCLIEVES